MMWIQNCFQLSQKRFWRKELQKLLSENSLMKKILSHFWAIFGQVDTVNQVVKMIILSCNFMHSFYLNILLNNTLFDNLFLATTIFIIFWDFLIDEQIFFLPQVKRSVIHSNKHGIYELPHKLLNDFRLTCFPHGIFAAGGGLCAHTRKKKT